MVIGGGVVGMNAAFIAIGMEADVFVFDRQHRPPARARRRLRRPRLDRLLARRSSIEEMLPRADLVIGAVLVHGATRARTWSRREQLGADEARRGARRRRDRPGRLLRDLAARPPTRDPTYEVDGIIHYCVANMPGAVPITSTYALTNATLPVRARARRPRRGRGASRRDPGLRPGVNVAGGKVTHPAVAEGVGMRLRPVEEALDIEPTSRPTLRHAMAHDTRSSRPMATATEDQAQELHRRRVRRRRRRRDRGRDQPGDRRGDRRGAALDRGGRRPRRAGGRASAFDELGRARRPASARRRCCKLADLIEEHGEEIADLESADAGKPRDAFARGRDPGDGATTCASSPAPPATMEGQAAGEYMEGHTSIIRREPVGVVGQITPWNYPLMMAIWKIGPALAAGNTVVLKPAETTPLHDAAARRARAPRSCPPGVLNVIGGHGEPAGLGARHATPTSTWSR